MKRNKYFQALSFLCVLTLIGGFANTHESEVVLGKISVHAGKLNTKVLLEAQSPMPVVRSYYAPDLPSTVVVDLKCSDPSQEVQAELEDSELVKDVNLEKGDGETLRLLIGLNEKVPYRIYSSQNTTIIELNKLRHVQGGEYILDTESHANSIRLSGVTVSTDEQRLNITAKMTEEVLTHVFALNNPLRLVVDLYDTLLTSKSSDYPIYNNGVVRVRTAQFQNSDTQKITRLVFDLTEPKFYTIDTHSGEFTVSFYNEPGPELAQSWSEPEPETVEEVVTYEEEPVKTLEIEKETPVHTADTYIEEASIQTSDKPFAENSVADIAPQETEEEGINETPAPPEESEPTVWEEDNQTLSAPDIEPYEEPEPAVETHTEKTELAKNAEPNGNGSAHYMPQEQFTPQTVAEQQVKYTGDILSLKFKDADLRDVILYLADFAGLNVVFDPEVRGTVTVDLKDTPWDQALDIILRINKMGKTLEGNVLRIAPTAVLAREKEEERRLQEAQVIAGPTVVKTFTLSYSRASEVEGLLRSKMSERGEMIVDERTNTLIITEVRDRMEVLERLINVFDTATPQVSIEARIVEATSTFIRNLGVQWGFRGINDPFYGNQTSLQFPNRTLVDGALIPQGIVTKGVGGPLGGYGINLPAPAFTTAVGLSMANVLDTFRIDMALTALETSGEGRIISAPKVTTQNNQEAEIIQGRQIPVQTVANFTVTTRYVNAALELRATPQITAEGTIIMYIEIRNNAADFANLVNGIPPITTQSAQTTVMVPNGGTTVIGGIYRTEDSITREKVPLLHKIPILGNLFKSFARTKQTRELLIFITPRIIR
ncbi:MAG: type IV pilus secretin PilQ [Candidatus Aminicenantes bacterium]|jgi:type IV pilus assembly protein PilQ